MTEPVQFHTRGDVGLGTPSNTSGSTRPLMLMNRPIHTLHYTGLEPRQIWFSGGDGVFESIDSVYRFMENLERVAKNAGKPFEYNTTIPIMADNSAHVVAYADEYVAAHSAGENTIAHGTLIIAGVGQDLNDGAILAFQWWNAVLEATGRLTQNSSITPHNKMDGAQTACPGVKILSRLPELRMPYVAPAPPTKPPTVIIPPSSKDENLMVTIFKPIDCDAQFIGMADKNGVCLEVEWISSDPKSVSRRDQHWLAGAKVDEGPCKNGRFKNCNLIGPLPVGDTRHKWSEADFHKIRP